MGKIVEELIKGRNLTKELQILMKMPCDDDVVISQRKELVGKIFGSLTEAISLMSSGSSFQNSSTLAPSFGGWRSGDSGLSNERPAAKDRKRRKCSDSRINVSSSMVDEYAWRKYGQKETHNATYPRCYFRCTHKHDQGCKATRQVQRIQEEPIKYQITYFGHHTCRNILQPNLENIMLDSYSEESNLINFQLYTPSDVYHSSSWPSSVEEETKEVQNDLTSDDLSPSDTVNWPNLTTLIRSDIKEEFIPGIYSYASPVAQHGMNMDFFFECDKFANFVESIY